LSVRDLAAGSVTLGRLATHLAVLVGLLFLLGLDRAERALPPGRSSSARERDTGDSNLRTVA
jgi:hypothetical protein